MIIIQFYAFNVLNIQSKEVYRRTTVHKNSYCKTLIILFIWLIACSRCLQLFLRENPLEKPS